jgi:methyl-accepting chemotaxis protein
MPRSRQRAPAKSGRGFAVVAQEVKALASQTAKATDEIGIQIAGMQTATQEAVGSIKMISSTNGKISEITRAISAAIEQRGAATQEISGNIQRTASGTSQVAGTIAEVSQGANQTGAASSQLLSSARWHWITWERVCGGRMARGVRAVFMVCG